MVTKLISDVCEALRTDARNVEIAFSQCKATRVLRKQEFLQLINSGIPVHQIYSNVMRIPMSETQSKIIAGTITYDELLCVLGIFAQDIAVVHQRNLRDRIDEK